MTLFELQYHILYEYTTYSICFYPNFFVIIIYLYIFARHKFYYY